jgi:3-oxoacyl-[acyl-carrier protein] reductase
MNVNLIGMRALVTGGGAGIGRAISLAMAGAGADIAVMDLDGEAAVQVAAEVEQLGRKGLALRGSVSDPASVQSVVEAMIAGLGGIDILVNNAGYARPTESVLDLSEDQWDRVLSVNLKGPFLLSKAVLTYMKQQHSGRIINISSLAGRSTSVFMGADYTASKAGLLGFTRHLAREVAPHGIRVNAVCPGSTDTGFIQSATPEARQATAKAVPLGRMGTPDEIAGAVLFLASDLSSYVTGTTLDVNGGLLMI